MIMKDLLTKNPEELETLIQDLKAELFMLRFKNKTGQQDQTHKIALVRKDVARIFTALNIKQEESIKTTIKLEKSKFDKTLKKEVKGGK